MLFPSSSARWCPTQPSNAAQISLLVGSLPWPFGAESSASKVSVYSKPCSFGQGFPSILDTQGLALPKAKDYGYVNTFALSSSSSVKGVMENGRVSQVTWVLVCSLQLVSGTLGKSQLHKKRDVTQADYRCLHMGELKSCLGSVFYLYSSNNYKHRLTLGYSHPSPSSPREDVLRSCRTKPECWYCTLLLTRLTPCSVCMCTVCMRIVLCYLIPCIDSWKHHYNQDTYRLSRHHQGPLFATPL